MSHTNLLIICKYGAEFVLTQLFFFFLLTDSDSTEAETTVQDILTCGSCQKQFALSDIVKFIQHKVVQCNKENFGQCSTQSKF